MCGIAGFVDFKKTSDQFILKEMTNAMVHRGPDASGIKTIELGNTLVGLGHRRLSILDLSEGGAQPMFWSHLSITYNGEIYNFREIKKELMDLGHHFMTESDTEMILHAYAEWGECCLDRFIGMFAFAIVDEKAHQIFIARDRVGVKPIFYYHTPSLFLFGSELKTLLPHPQFTKKMDRDSIASFLKYGNIPAPKSIYENCFKLQPGHFITLSAGKTVVEINTSKYWSVYDAYNRPKLDISINEAKHDTKKLLRSAFEYRMVSDVPVGVFLSGGYDSAAVASLLQESGKHQLKTFTIAVPDIGLNEAPFAKEVAGILGTEHQELACTEKEALEIIPTLAHFYDEPFADSSAIPTTLLSKWVKTQVTVALSADGGDELFAGYNRYDYLIRYGTKLNRIPASLRHLSSQIMGVIPANKLPYFKHQYNFANRFEKLKNLLKDPSPENMMWSLSQQFTEPQINELLIEPATFHQDAYTKKELKVEFYSPLAYMQAIDCETYLVDDILQKVDRATMSASLEGREPFLDHRVIEYVASLPDDYKYRKGIKKFLLKEIVHDYIPKEKMERPKMGFAIPIEKWLAKDLKPMVDHYLSESFIIKQDIFNPKAIQKWKQAFNNGKTEYGFKIWYLLCFQMWYEKYMA